MLSPQPHAPVLRLVPPPPAGVREPLRAPAPEILNEMETKVREWLHGEHLDGCDGLRNACWELLNRVNEFLVPYLAEASDAVREFLRMAGEAEPAEDADAGDDLGWGAREFLRLAEVAQKVTPLHRP